VIFKNDVSDGEFGHYLYGKPLDYGASVFIAYEFWNKLYVQVSAQQSIHNLYPNDGGIKPNATVRNRGYGISLGYRFN